MDNFEFIKADINELRGEKIFAKITKDQFVDLGMFKAIISRKDHDPIVHAQHGSCFLDYCYIRKNVSYETKEVATDPVNNPGHYNQYKIPVVDMTDSILATIKDPVYAAYFKTIYEYLSRAHLKNGAEDIKKAQWWLNRLIAKIDNSEAQVK